MSEEEIEDLEQEEQEVAVDLPESSFIQRYKIPIIGGIVGTLAIVLIVVFVRGGDASSNNKNTSLSQTEGTIVNKADMVVKPKKKKKKIKYAQLFSQMDSGDTSKILKELSIRNITFSTVQAGQKFSIMVDEEQIDEARNLLAMKGIPSGTAKRGYELLDDAATLGVTEFDKRIRFLRALSGELEIAITKLDIIESAKVQIVLPEQRLFTVTQPPVTSSIVIRIVNGTEITDEIVFSIIQMVSGSVENLQAENVSVIDTDGNLLSDGIFERLAAKKAGILLDEEEEEEVIEAAISREEAIGTPIMPNYDRIQEWFEIKWDFENQLKEKVERQLFGIMPIGAFKVEVATDIGPLENGNIVDIKRQTISIVVDGLNDDIFVDRAFKQQVFQTVAGSIGYVRGRDSIQLSIAEFALYTEDEIRDLRNKYAKQGFWGVFWKILLGVGGVSFLYWIFTQVKLRFSTSKEDSPIDLREDLSELDAIPESPLDISTNVQEIKQFASNSPTVLASVMEDWIGATSDESQNKSIETDSVEDETLVGEN